MTDSSSNALLVSANRAHKAGDFLRSLDLYKEVLQNEPENVAALYPCGILLAKMGRTPEALQHFETVLKIEPNNVDALLTAGRIELQHKRPNEAIKHATRLIELQPNRLDAYLLRAAGYVAEEQFDLAVEDYKLAVEFDGKNIILIRVLADNLNKLRRSDEAITWYQHGLKISPQNSKFLMSYASCLRQNGQNAKAVELMQAGYDKNKNDVEFIQNYAAHVEEEGLFERAEHLYIEALKLRPRNALTLGSIIRNSEFNKNQDLVTSAHRLLEDSSKPTQDRIFIGYSLGRYYDQQKEYSSAFKAYSTANALRAQENGYNPQLLEDFVEANLQTRQPDVCISSKHREAPAPIFIVGMPRSGTTLVEQILSSHSQVTGRGEIDFFVRSLGVWNQEPNSKGWPDTLASLTSEQLNTLRDDYLGQLRLGHSETNILSDKMPFNFLYIGLIRKLFPSAKIIHCVRHPLDTCLSIFFENLSDKFSFALSQDRLAHFFLSYRKLMDHWESQQDNQIFDFSYERLLETPEDSVRRLLSHCGLTWEASCLEFHKTERSVLTPSNWQVRQPLYKTSNNRRENYKDHISELSSELSDAIKTYESRYL